MESPPATALALALASAAGVVLLLAAEARRDGFGAFGVPLFKTLASLSFVCVGALARPWGGRAAGALFAGLVLCALGDVLLIPRGASRAFLLGLVAFLLGHVAYGVSFASAAPAPEHVAAAAAVLALPAGLSWRRLRRSVPARLKAPVAAYIVVITGMVALAAARAATDAPRGGALLAAATAFWLSDLFVARERFLTPGLVNRLVGLPLYFGAQIAFALCLFAL